MKQSDLFDYPRGPGHRGVPTSAAAAEFMRAHVGPIQQRILNFLHSAGPAGATYTEIMAACGLGAPTVCGRMVELVAAKLVRIAAHTRPTPSRRQARVYVAAEFA